MAKKSKMEVGTMLCYGYFRSAQLAIEYLLAQKNIGKTPLFGGEKYLYPNYKPLFTLESGSILIAARFNFRHALELSMKSLFSTAKINIPAGHDLGNLCKKMKSNLLNKSILQSSFDAWKWLIEIYYSKDKFAPNDRNELDRYMFSKIGHKFPYKNIHTITSKDLKLFLGDIKTAKNLFWRMSSEYTFINYCKKFGLDPEKKYRHITKIIICKLPSGRYITRRKTGVCPSKMLDS